MTLPRPSIARVMAVVAVAAVNLAVLRALYTSRREDTLLGGAFVWLLLEVGAYRALRRAGRVRTYWLGFVGGGIVASLSLVAAHHFRGSVAGRIWSAYGNHALPVIVGIEAPLFRRLGNTVACELKFVALIAALEYGPIVLAALASGLLARKIVGPRGFAQVPPAIRA